MELIPNTAHVYFEFSGTSNVGGNELKVIRNVYVPLNIVEWQVSAVPL